MITLKDSIEVKATPEKVYEWLVARFKDKESYQAWHPDHVDIRWIKGEPFGKARSSMPRSICMGSCIDSSSVLPG